MPRLVTVTDAITPVIPRRAARAGYRLRVVSGAPVALSYLDADPADEPLTFANGDPLAVGERVFVVDPELARRGVRAIAATGTTATLSLEELV